MEGARSVGLLCERSRLQKKMNVLCSQSTIKYGVEKSAPSKNHVSRCCGVPDQEIVSPRECPLLSAPQRDLQEDPKTKYKKQVNPGRRPSGSGKRSLFRARELAKEKKITSLKKDLKREELVCKSPGEIERGEKKGRAPMVQ